MTNSAAVTAYWDAAQDFDDEPDHGLRAAGTRAAWARVLSAWLPSAPADVRAASQGSPKRRCPYRRFTGTGTVRCGQDPFVPLSGAFAPSSPARICWESAPVVGSSPSRE